MDVETAGGGRISCGQQDTASTRKWYSLKVKRRSAKSDRIGRGGALQQRVVGTEVEEGDDRATVILPDS
eukprot:4280705-Pleurochrysis_carterae.AAC.1